MKSPHQLLKECLCESLWDSGKSLPKIFNRTIYRLPTEEELEDVHDHELTPQDIVDGFSYTIIGRGMNSPKNSQMIIQSITMLSQKFPEDEVYRKALADALEEFGK